MPIFGTEQGGGSGAGTQVAAPKAAGGPSAPVTPISNEQPQAGTLVPPVGRGNQDIPPEAVEMTKMFFITAIVLVIGIPLIRAWIRRFDRKSEALRAGPQVNIEPQIRQLQDSIDGLTLEVERIAEGQRFMAKVIGDREKAPASLPSQKS